MLPFIKKNLQKGVSPIFIVVILAVVAIAGFVGYNQIQQNSKPKVLPVVPLITTNSTGTGLEAKIIEKYGLDKKNGFVLDSKHYFPGDLERRIGDRETDIGDFGLIALGAPLQGKKPLKVLLATYHANHLIVVPNNSPIKTVADLKGKTIAMQPKGAAGYVTFAVTMREYGINIDKDDKLLFGSNPEIVDFLVKGDADAAIMSHPSITATLLTGKYRVIGKMEDLWKAKTGRSQPFVVLVAYDDWITQHKDLAKSVIAAYTEAAQLIKQRPEVLTEDTDFLAAMGVKSDAAKKMIQDNLQSDYYTEWNDQVAGDVKFLLQKSIDAGLFPKDINLDDVIAKL